MKKILITAILIASSIFYSDCRSHNNASSLDNSPTKKTGCSCNLGNKPTVPDLFIKETVDYERLVIYLYKNSKNNKILLHIPDNVKQEYLPDIIFEEKDILKTVADEKLVDIFVNHPKYIVSKSEHVKQDDINPYTSESPTTTHKIPNHGTVVIEVKTPKHHIENSSTESPSHVKKHHENINKTKPEDIPPSKVDHNQNISPVKIPPYRKKGDNKIHYYHPEDFENNYPNKDKYIKDHDKPVPIKKHHDHTHNPDYIPVNVVTEPSTVVVKHPDHVPSNSIDVDKHSPTHKHVIPASNDDHHSNPHYHTRKPAKINHHYHKKDETNHEVNKPHTQNPNDVPKHVPDTDVKIPSSQHDNSKKHPSTSKTPTTKHPKQNETNDNIKYPDNYVIIPPVKVVPNKIKPHENEKPYIDPSHGPKDVSQNHSPTLKPIEINHEHPSIIPSRRKNNENPSHHPSPKDVSKIDIPSSNHDDFDKPVDKENNDGNHDHKYPKSKPNTHYKNPSSVDVSSEKKRYHKKHRNSTPKTSYETIVDIIINYPEFVMSPDGTSPKPTALKVKKSKGDKQNEITVKVPGNSVIAPSDERIPILRIPISKLLPGKPNYRKYYKDDPVKPTSKENNQFEEDTNNIYYKKPEEDVLIKDESNTKEKSNDLSICNYCKQKAMEKDKNNKPPEVNIYIPEHIPDNRDHKDVLKPEIKKPICSYCNQNNIHNDNYNSDPTHARRSDNSITDIEDKTFDQWFREEMYGFRQEEDIIDVSWVGKYILKILNDHDLHISKDGFLIDSSGKVLPLQNLKLRPMLVGDSMSLKTILKSSGIKEEHPEYVAFVILMTIDPPTTLGIIPLGRTVLPFSTASIQTLSNILNPNDISNKNYLLGPHYNEKSKSKEAGRYKKRASNDYEESVERFLKTMPHRSFPLNHQIPDDDDILDNHTSEKNNHNHDYINSEDLYGNDDMLRIIGGSAATGSGTPVSSKGKSLRLDD